jgi:hypothetical protein
MAIQVSGFVAPRGERAEPKERKLSDMEKILQGLQIIQAGFGIATDYQKLGQIGAQTELTEAKAESLMRPPEPAPEKPIAKKITHRDEVVDPATGALERVTLATDPLTGETVETGRAPAGFSPQIISQREARAFKEAQAAKAPPKESQAKAALFAKRMEEAEKDFSELERKGFQRAQLGTAAVTALPDFLNFLKSEEIQRQQQAERNFVNAVLRRESGAVISQEEFDNAALQYFPRGGDTAPVLEQKKRNRTIAIEALRKEGGKAFEELTTPQRFAPPQAVPGAAIAEPPKSPAERLKEIQLRKRQLQKENPDIFGK